MATPYYRTKEKDADYDPFVIRAATIDYLQKRAYWYANQKDKCMEGVEKAFSFKPKQKGENENGWL